MIYPVWTHHVSCRNPKRIISLPPTIRLISWTIWWPVLWILNSQRRHFRIQVEFCGLSFEKTVEDIDPGLCLWCGRHFRDVPKNTKSVLCEVLGPLIRLGARRHREISLPKSFSCSWRKGLEQKINCFRWFRIFGHILKRSKTPERSPRSISPAVFSKDRPQNQIESSDVWSHVQESHPITITKTRSYLQVNCYIILFQHHSEGHCCVRSRHLHKVPAPCYIETRLDQFFYHT